MHLCDNTTGPTVHVLWQAMNYPMRMEQCVENLVGYLMDIIFQTRTMSSQTPCRCVSSYMTKMYFDQAQHSDHFKTNNCILSHHIYLISKVYV